MGSGNTYTVTVNTGDPNVNGTIRLDVADDDSIKDQHLTPLGGVGLGNGNFIGPFYTMAKATVIYTYTSVAAFDGWALESTETSNIGGSRNATAATLRVGDDLQNRQYRSILHFNTADNPIPDNAHFFKVTLRIRQQSITGANPFSVLGNISVDVRRGHFGTMANLENNDFQASASALNIMRFRSAASSGWRSAVIGSNHYEWIDRNGTTQFRLRFRTDDNNDFMASYVSFHSGNAMNSDDYPQLIIEFFSSCRRHIGPLE